METYLLFGLLIGVVAVGVAIYLKGRQPSDLSARIDSLNQNMTENLNTVTKTVLEQLNSVTSQVGGRLKENSETMQRQHKNVADRLDNAGRVIKDVTAHLSKMEESNKRVHDLAKDLVSLQDILKTPKLRGSLGELFLEELLSQIFSKDQYSLQHRFKSGEIVDAVVRLRDDLLVPVDAKFPLENFKKMIEVKDENESERLRKTFVSDVKKHIDVISKKYLLPDEGTLDFALMYIPAENVYYETIIKDASGVSISQYGLEKHVIPVSPNSFNIYLHTVLIGLKGMQIEKGAKEIFNNLTRLRTEFNRFGKDFELVGTHLGRARSSYENSEKRLSRLNDKLVNVSGSESEDPLLLPEVEESTVLEG
ncbi:DNA recombination protein RmuC [Candidatus Peregrinibacteria bacterium]|nr:DNA recombination protein RmuC [Candidatus Peregrinibacteria bacterium]MBT4148249.1 DNA recombination protein RmuC [Candidatus Peregrinibacteria bacterium]MBT4366579.1 DNA recombination protein RmuC [Candidatus Peregrinibacteria bacterium]MBT4456606.1 DNA recombination protein RmuC [Candidatus Peregrinibacteria bacterium]